MEIRSEKVILNILALMAKAGLNQRQLALKANVTPEYLNKIIKGKRGLGMSVASKLAKALSCTTDSIFLERVEKKPTATVGSLLQALTELEKENAQLKANPVLVAYEKLEHDSLEAQMVRVTLGIDQPATHSETRKIQEKRSHPKAKNK